MIRLSLTGERFNMLTVKGLAGMSGRRSLWHCRCDCGRDHTTYGNALRSGHTRSCGCLRVSKLVANNRARHSRRDCWRALSHALGYRA